MLRWKSSDNRTPGLGLEYSKRADDVVFSVRVPATQSAVSGPHLDQPLLQLMIHKPNQVKNMRVVATHAR